MELSLEVLHNLITCIRAIAKVHTSTNSTTKYVQPENLQNTCTSVVCCSPYHKLSQGFGGRDKYHNTQQSTNFLKDKDSELHRGYHYTVRIIGYLLKVMPIWITSI